MDEELDCTICKYRFGTGMETNPRTLGCGHTFCTRCLQNLFRLNKKACPECREPIAYSQVTLIPISITILRICSALDVQDRPPDKTADSSADKLQEYQDMILQIKDNKKHVMFAAESAKIGLNEKLQDLSINLGELKELFSKEGLFRKDLNKVSPSSSSNNLRHNNDMKSVNAWICNTIKQIIIFALGTSKAVWAVEYSSNKTNRRYAKITKQNELILLHCLQDTTNRLEIRKDDVLVPYHIVKGFLDISTPSAFLDFDWKNGNGLLTIELSKNSKRAQQFALLCSGEHSFSYTNTKLIRITDKGQKGQTIWGGDYENNNGTGGATILQEPIEGYDTSFQLRGIITTPNNGAYSKKRTAQFGICLLDHRPYKFLGSFGKVTEGLQVLDAVSCYPNIREVIVKNCGMVLPIEVKCYL